MSESIGTLRAKLNHADFLSVLDTTTKLSQMVSPLTAKKDYYKFLSEFGLVFELLTSKPFTKYWTDAQARAMDFPSKHVPNVQLSLKEKLILNTIFVEKMAILEFKTYIQSTKAADLPLNDKLSKLKIHLFPHCMMLEDPSYVSLKKLRLIPEGESTATRKDLLLYVRRFGEKLGELRARGHEPSLSAEKYETIKTILIKECHKVDWLTFTVMTYGNTDIDTCLELLRGKATVESVMFEQ